MKDIKLSFPYPSTSRHNLSQDIGTSLSIGLVTPVRVIEVLGGDSHRIGTSFSLISNPLVKPLLQGVNMRYCRFWVPRRIYHLDQRANNSNFDILEAPVRHGVLFAQALPIFKQAADSPVVHASNFQQSSLLSYLQIDKYQSNLVFTNNSDTIPSGVVTFPSSASGALMFNAEPYIGYIDICRNYFADSATNTIAFTWLPASSTTMRTLISPLVDCDTYIDQIQNSRGAVHPFYPVHPYNSGADHFDPFFLSGADGFKSLGVTEISTSTFGSMFKYGHLGFCVPLNRPDRLSRLFDTKPLTSQSAIIDSSEVSIGNLSFLTKLQRYLSRRFFGGSRFTDVMYSVLGQRVPHVDSPVLLDVFDTEIGSELVASTNATETKNPGVLGGYFCSAGHLTTHRGSTRRRYSFNEPGYIIDLVYIMPRLFRCAFYPDFYPISGGATEVRDTPMMQSNFIPDFNGIGWQQPAFASTYYTFTSSSSGTSAMTSPGFCSEPSWQQFRTLPDVCTGALDPLNSPIGAPSIPANGYLFALTSTNTINSPLFTFNDRMEPYNVAYGFTGTDNVIDIKNRSRLYRARFAYSDPNMLNSVFGSDILYSDNIFVIFRYAHQAKRQVTKRFTLSFN